MEHNVTEFFLQMIPPTVTHQEKKARIIYKDGKPVPLFYEPAELEAARSKLTAYLGKHVPNKPYTGAVRCVVKWLFPITNKKHYDGEWKNTAPDTHNMDKLLFDVLEHSGISKQMLEKYKFDSYETPYQWQKDMKNKSLAFIAENLDTAGKWLYIGGQSGAGKTHICTAICQRLAKKYTVRYELWSRVGGLIKSRAMEQDEKDKLLYELAKPEVMYVDDLLKGTSKVTDGDIKALFDLINTRYLNNNSITIISSELSLEELKRIDEAIAGRIAERAQGYTLALPRNGKFNYRFKEAEK